MDKELSDLHDLARQMLIDIKRQFEAGITPPGFGKSDYRKIKKALSHIDFDPEGYGDIMSDAGGNVKELQKKIRNLESRTMKAWELLPEDSIHHLIQSRTGGNWGAEVDGATVRAVVSRLQDRFQKRFSQATGPSGNVSAATAQSNWSHKSDDTAMGLERESGIGKNPNPSTTSHRLGTAGYAKDLTPDQLKNVDTIYDELSKRFESQYLDAKVGQATDAPRVETIRQQPGLEHAYSEGVTLDEQKTMQKLARQLKKTNPELFLQSYRNLLSDNGSVRLNSMDPLTPILHEMWKNPLGTTAGVLMEGYNKDTIQKFQQGDTLGGGTDIAGLAGTLKELPDWVADLTG